MAQCVWCLASLIGLVEGLVVLIDKFQIRSEIVPPPIAATVKVSRISEESESSRHNRILEECEEYLCNSWRLRDLESLKAMGKRRTGRLNQLKNFRRALSIGKRENTKDYSKTEGIDYCEIGKKKSAGEWFRCAMPSDRNGTHGLTIESDLLNWIKELPVIFRLGLINMRNI
jgi:hypothetical protein